MFFAFFVSKALQIFLDPASQSFLNLAHPKHLRQVCQADHTFHFILVLLLRVLAHQTGVINSILATGMCVAVFDSLFILFLLSLAFSLVMSLVMLLVVQGM